MNVRLPKNEKLKSSKTIEKLFSEGKSFSKFPVKIIFIEQEGSGYNKAAFAVPKRNFKSAVDRNRIKRQLREAYRLNKQSFNKDNERSYAMLFLYLGKVKPKYSSIENAIQALLKKIDDESK